MTRSVSVLIGLAMLSVMVVVPVLAAEPVECEQEYTIKEGDRLQNIADTYYGSKTYYKEIVEATNAKAETDDAYSTIENPSYIRAGWKLCLPEIEGIAPMSGTGDETPAPEGLEPEALMNMTYRSEFGEDGTVTLKDGKYEVEAAPGSASKIQVEMTEHVAYGELDGQPAAAVILWSSGGGSGVFFDVHVVMLQDGEPVDVASAPIEDRAKINSIKIEGNKIIIDMVGHGPDEPMCCPTQQQVRTYELKDANLEQTSLEVTGTAGGEGAGADTGQS